MSDARPHFTAQAQPAADQSFPPNRMPAGMEDVRPDRAAGEVPHIRVNTQAPGTNPANPSDGAPLAPEAGAGYREWRRMYALQLQGTGAGPNAPGARAAALTPGFSPEQQAVLSALSAGLGMPLLYGPDMSVTTPGAPDGLQPEPVTMQRQQTQTSPGSEPMSQMPNTIGSLLQPAARLPPSAAEAQTPTLMQNSNSAAPPPAPAVVRSTPAAADTPANDGAARSSGGGSSGGRRMTREVTLGSVGSGGGIDMEELRESFMSTASIGSGSGSAHDHQTQPLQLLQGGAPYPVDGRGEEQCHAAEVDSGAGATDLRAARL